MFFDFLPPEEREHVHFVELEQGVERKMYMPVAGLIVNAPLSGGGWLHKDLDP